jgi:hypothetical protein
MPNRRSAVAPRSVIQSVLHAGSSTSTTCTGAIPAACSVSMMLLRIIAVAGHPV